MWIPVVTVITCFPLTCVYMIWHCGPRRSKLTRNTGMCMGISHITVSQWCVYPRHITSDMCISVHITSDMCIPSNMPASEMCNPSPPTKCRFYFLLFFVNFVNHHQVISQADVLRGPSHVLSSRRLQMIQDYEQHNQQKRNDSRQNNRKQLFLASLHLKGQQCCCKHSLSIPSLSLVVLNKQMYDWRNFIQQR